MKSAGLLLLALSACSTTATVTTSTRRVLEVHLEPGDADTLLATTEAGAVVSIPRTEVRDIDHPGNGHVVAGAIVAGSGALTLATVYPLCNGPLGGPCLSGTVFTAVGLPLLAWGLWTWLSSQAAVAPVRDQDGRVRAVPQCYAPPPALPAQPLPSDVPSL